MKWVLAKKAHFSDTLWYLLNDTISLDAPNQSAADKCVSLTVTPLFHTFCAVSIIYLYSCKIWLSFPFKSIPYFDRIL